MEKSACADLCLYACVYLTVYRGFGIVRKMLFLERFGSWKRKGCYRLGLKFLQTALYVVK
ncbi:hypothetical protein D0T90_08005 [Neisseria animalis]|uniref:Uncharacterized protein n=1 Tax=Neisseria animalis TaxID=492 RepID=A0A5P3MSJ8_NEIAN|nr:hypothetical protein D0T90_08005 [Neisseria animalis]ROW31897.1 hypothetical protein CGZ60_07760 [Neisseria animalis]VEE07022.1 Uncharacterised protein [Neisseria animalis]